jgi:uncharacterized DUF497 family protein
MAPPREPKIDLMNLEFDAAKNAINIEKHGLSLKEAGDFDFAVAVVVVDDRFDYGEIRYPAFARMGGKGYCLVFTLSGATLRPISYRRAHEKEMRRHGL